MPPLIWVITWCWGEKFGQHYVDRLSRSVQRHLDQPHKFVVVSPGAGISADGGAARWALKDEPLIKERGCFARLRMFDPEWLRSNGVYDGERVVCIDLDTVITGPLDPLFDRPEPFVIMQGGNAANPCPYNGALSMLRCGYRSDVWSDFSLEAARDVPFYEFPDDQSWLNAKIPNAPGWQVGAGSGVYCFQKRGWPGGTGLPSGARLVTFRGNNPPSKHVHIEWVAENWR